MLFRTESIAGRNRETVFDCTLPAGMALEIRNIAVVIFESIGTLLPFRHPLWWTSLFSFRVQSFKVYERPIHRFADPVLALALHQELEPEDMWRYIGKLNPDLDFPYMLDSQCLAECRLTPRVFNDEIIPKDAHAMVILDGRMQRIVI